MDTTQECSVCGKKFSRNTSEVNRSKRLGRRAFCSRRCCGKASVGNIPEQYIGVTTQLNAGNRQDEFSAFRWHLRNCTRRNKECDLTLEYLKEQWERQGGKCPYTGWPLQNMVNTSYSNQLPLTPDRASLDRIDSKLGYVKGNVHFVAVMAQYAKHVFTEDDLVKFCKDVVKSRRCSVLVQKPD